MTSRPTTGLPDDARPKPSVVAPPPAAQPQADGPLTGSLPLAGDADSDRHRLSPRVVGYWRWRWLLSLIPLLALLAALAVVIPWGDAWIRWAVVTVVAVAGLVAMIVLPPIRYRVFWYSISPTEIDIQHGVIFIKRSVIPMHRVQSLRVERGPIADRYRMVNLRITTAASSLSCPGLDRAEADEVCTRINELADVADDL